MITLEQKVALQEFAKQPNLFFRKVLGADPEPYQERINQTVADNERTVISSCHDLGKTWDIARLVLWALSCFPYSKVITTAPTYNQVKNILWAELRSAHARAKFPLGGSLTLTEWKLDDGWVALGFSPRNELSPEAGQGTASSFQGFHAEGGIFVFFDEATGVRKMTWDMAEGIMTQAFVRFVGIGNPTSRLCEFFRCFISPAYTKIKLSCFDSPNLIANNITTLEQLKAEVNVIRAMSDPDAQERMKSYKVVKPWLLSLRWVVQMALPSKWGFEHPLFISKVLGEFPIDADGTLISMFHVEQAQYRTYYPIEGDRKTLGVDVARFGSDATVLTGLHGKKHLLRKSLIKKSGTEVVGEIIALGEIWDVIVVDETGMGGPIVDMLREAVNEGRLNRNTEIRGVQFGAGVECDGNDECQHKDCQKAKYVNLKARMFGLLRDDVKASDGLCLSNDDVYLEELPTIIYKYDSKGRMYIESKDEYKKRTGRKSPDDADSLALANYGRYDELTVGTFGGFGRDIAKPFAASLGGGRAGE